MLADKTFQHIYSKSDAHRPIGSVYKLFATVSD